MLEDFGPLLKLGRLESAFFWLGSAELPRKAARYRFAKYGKALHWRTAPVFTPIALLHIVAMFLHGHHYYKVRAS